MIIIYFINFIMDTFDNNLIKMLNVDFHNPVMYLPSFFDNSKGVMDNLHIYFIPNRFTKLIHTDVVKHYKAIYQCMDRDAFVYVKYNDGEDVKVYVSKDLGELQKIYLEK